MNIPARVHQTTAVVGTGAYSLLPLADGYDDYRSYYDDGDVVPFVVVDENETDMEIGAGTLTYGVPDVISRDAVVKSSNANAPVSWSAGTKHIFAWRVHGAALSPEEFGAKGDGLADDTVAVFAWVATLLATQAEGHINGWYRMTSDLFIDLTGIRLKGLKITGRGWNICGFVFDAGHSMSVYSSSGDAFYPTFRDFSIHGEINGVLCQLGNPNIVASNQLVFDSIELKNKSSSSSAVALGLAALYNCRIFVTANCNGKGTGLAAIRINGHASSAVAFCMFFISAGNSTYGMKVDSGFFYSNAIVAVDFEEVYYDLGGDSPSIGVNTIAGGTAVYDVAAFNFSQWNGYQYWDAPGLNLAPNVLGAPTFAPGSKITVRTTGKEYSVTPDVPASGVHVRNVLPNNIMVVVTSGVDNAIESLHIENPDEPGENITLTVGAPGAPLSVPIRPGQQVALNYSGSTPSWLWLSVF